MSESRSGSDETPRTPLAMLEVLASQEVEISDHFRHLELFTMRGLLTVLWHGVGTETAAVVACGGAMGGLLGPADGLYHELGEQLVANGVAMLRVGYRRPNDMDLCCIDVAAAVQLAVGHGAETTITMGHSFGGAVAVRVAVGLPEMVGGVVTYATQSAGCEVAGGLSGRPLLLFHGDRDEILPLDCSAIVREIAGTGDLVVLPGDGHLLSKSGPILRERTLAFIGTVLGRAN